MHIKAEHGQKGTGVEVILEGSDKPHPHCIHGPALLFERFSQKDDPVRFFACSAYRSRKECSLYVFEDKPWSEDKVSSRRSVYNNERTSTKWYIKPSSRSKHVQAIRTSNQYFCKSCSSFIMDPDEPDMHSDHTTIKTSYKSVTNPTTLLYALTANQGNAQFIFSTETSQFLLKIFTEGGYSHVVCIGTPRIHEMLSTQSKKISSLLLDLDDRFAQFYPPTSFQHYNLMANYFFESSGHEYLEKFLKKGKKVAIIFDPPFGATARVIDHSLNQLTQDIIKACPDTLAKPTTFWIYPHFLSKHVKEASPTLQMCHFPIEYENHPVFKAGDSYSKSPVRLFTDHPLDAIELRGDLFRLCRKCGYWVPRDVSHCGKCGGCPTVNRASRHCDTCGRCVAEAYEHCSECVGCRPIPHHCKPPSVCHRCGDTGHKRRFCPKESAKEPQKEADGGVMVEGGAKGESKNDTGTGKYFTIYSEDKKKELRMERKRQRKDEKRSKKASLTKKMKSQ